VQKPPTTAPSIFCRAFVPNANETISASDTDALQSPRLCRRRPRRSAVCPRPAVAGLRRDRCELTQKNGKQNYRTLSFLSCVWWAEKIYLPTKHTKRRENFKDEDRLVRVPSTRSGVCRGERLYNIGGFVEAGKREMRDTGTRVPCCNVRCPKRIGS